jgi:hypothetical protein
LIDFFVIRLEDRVESRCQVGVEAFSSEWTAWQRWRWWKRLNFAWYMLEVSNNESTWLNSELVLLLFGVQKGQKFFICHVNLPENEIHRAECTLFAE